MDFQRSFFDPALAPSPVAPPHAPDGIAHGDLRDGGLYVSNDEIVLAVNAALATGRPLLVEGPPGSGKSSLAAYVARTLGWWYYEQSVTSRTSAQELLWEFDALRRLNDAQVQGRLQPSGAYVEPGIFWWAFDPESASRRGSTTNNEALLTNPGRQGTRPEAVVLLDEIDKADPDVPNDLLVPLGSRRFMVKESGALITPQREFLLVITTNGERDLAPAFIRRCVRLKLAPHDTDRLVMIARAHFGEKHAALYQPLAEWVVETRAAARRRGVREPSTAEFLDAIRACQRLHITPQTDAWKLLSQVVLSKVDPPEGVVR